MSKKTGTKYLSIVGSVISGASGNGWFGRCTGSESVISAIGDEGDIEVYVNSPGGSVFAGFEILNALNAAVKSGRSVTFYVSAMAASIASYITCGVKGAKVCMSENAKLMFHAPWTYTGGSKEQLRDTADLLAQMEDDIIREIGSRGGKVDAEWFAAGRMKWLSAKEAVALKFADVIADAPAKLIAEVAKANATQSCANKDYDDKHKDMRHKMSSADLMAASMTAEAYVQQVCEERFPESVVSSFAKDTFVLTKKDGSSALLKYADDSLNIVAIEWDTAVFEQAQENDMSDKAKLDADATAKAEADALAKVEAEAKELADAEAKAKEEADAKLEADALAKAEAEAAEEAAAKAKEEADAKANADAAPKLPAGLTEDMIVFATKNYKIERNGHIEAIKASKNCEFTDEELDGFTIGILSKIAKLAIVESDAAPVKTSDKSILAPKSAAKGTGGSLPPPEL